MLSLFQKKAIPSIQVNEVDNIIEEINLIDIREPYECAHGSIKNSVNIPMGQLMANPDRYLVKDKKYYIMCQSGGRSAGVVSALVRIGFDVVNVKGGMGGYSGKYRK